MGTFYEPDYLLKFTDDDSDQLIVTPWDDQEYAVMIRTSDNGVIFTKDELNDLIDKLHDIHANL